MRSTSTWEQQKKWDMGRKLNRLMLPTHVTRALQMPRYLFQKHAKRENFRHSTFQTQVHNWTNLNARGHDSTGAQWPHPSTEGMEKQEGHGRNGCTATDQWTPKQDSSQTNNCIKTQQTSHFQSNSKTTARFTINSDETTWIHGTQNNQHPQ